MYGLRKAHSHILCLTPGSLRKALAHCRFSVKARSETPPVDTADQGLGEEAVRRTASLRLASLKELKSDDGVLRGLKALVSILARYPLASEVVYHEGGVNTLLDIRSRNSTGSAIDQWARQACSLLGHADPVGKGGLRVLALDGGGVRGVLEVMIMERLLELCGNPPVSKVFDIVAGTSVGAVISALFMFAELRPGPLVPIYLELLNSVVRPPVTEALANVVKYRAKFGRDMTKMLESHLLDQTMTSTARNLATPKVIYTASLFGKGRESHPGPFVFRNYRLSPVVKPRYPGGCNYRVSTACAASSAAPGYFPSLNLRGIPMKDGGLLGNNPLSIVLHESRLLWGADVPFQCILSVGTGTVPSPQVNTWEESPGDVAMSAELPSASGVMDLLDNVVNSASSNQVMEHIMEDMLCNEPYFRFNPGLPYAFTPFSEDVPELLKLGEEFVARNEDRLRVVAEKLMEHT